MRATFIAEELDLKSGHSWKLYCNSPVGICQAYTAGGAYCQKADKIKGKKPSPCRFLVEKCISADGKLTACKEATT